MHMACSSVLSGGGTNQELTLHCLHECGGNILVSKRLVMTHLSCLVCKRILINIHS